MSRSTRTRTISNLVAETSKKTELPDVDTPAGEDAPVVASPLEHETARRMLEIAERLFAEQGIEQVPLRQIVVEAGQRNRSALHYHFGSREALVGHLINYRMDHVNALRERYLDEVEAEGKGGDVRSIVRASVRALADTIQETDWGPFYVQVLAQAMFSPSLANPDVIEQRVIRGVVRVRLLLRAAMPVLPQSVLEYRLLWINQGVVFSLATWYQQTRGEEGPPPVEELSDFYTAALCGPDTTSDATTPGSSRAGRKSRA